MPKYVVCTKLPNKPLKDGPINFVTAPSPPEAAALSAAKSGYPASATYRVLSVSQSKDFTITDTQTFAIDDGAGTVIQKSKAEVAALAANDTGV